MAIKERRAGALDDAARGPVAAQLGRAAGRLAVAALMRGPIHGWFRTAQSHGSDRGLWSCSAWSRPYSLSCRLEPSRGMIAREALGGRGAAPQHI